MKETIEYCDACGVDVRRLSFSGGTHVYRGRFNRGGWFWKGEEEAPEGDVSICGDCWTSLGRAVRERREAAVPQ